MAPPDEFSVVRLNNRRDEAFGDRLEALLRISEYRSDALPFFGRETVENALRAFAKVSRTLEPIEHRRKALVCIGVPEVCGIGGADQAHEPPLAVLGRHRRRDGPREHEPVLARADGASRLSTPEQLDRRRDGRRGVHEHHRAESSDRHHPPGHGQLLSARLLAGRERPRAALRRGEGEQARAQSPRAPRARRVVVRPYPERPVVGVGAVVLDGARVLLIKRGNAPLKGQWSLPGGGVEVGETLEQAVAREVLEETGLTIEVGPIVEVLDRISRDGDGRVEHHFVLVDFVCRPTGGVLRARRMPRTPRGCRGSCGYGVAPLLSASFRRRRRARVRHGRPAADVVRLKTAPPEHAERRRLGAADRIHEERQPAEARDGRRGRRPRLRAQIRREREEWGVVALLHDFDYERWPSADDHPFRGCEILKEQGLSGVGDARDSLARRVQRRSRESQLEKTLWACDEMAGFVTAASLVRPSKSIMDLEPASVVKRMKDKAFARAVKREDLRKGAEELGLPLDEHIGNVIAFMRERADALDSEERCDRPARISDCPWLTPIRSSPSTTSWSSTAATAR